MTTPRIGAPELTEGQAAPETTVNEQIRYVEQGASLPRFEDRDLSAAPGSPADGQCYLVAGTPSGGDDWFGQGGKLAFYMSTAWRFITPREGWLAYVKDEDVYITYDGTNWHTFALKEWSLNWTSDGDVYIAAHEAMTIAQGTAAIGGATITFEKSTTASPEVFASTTLPATLQAGAWLKVSAAGVSGYAATQLKRTL
jgi:hypothetical protein